MEHTAADVGSTEPVILSKDVQYYYVVPVPIQPRDEAKDSKKSTFYLGVAIVFLVLGFLFLWTYLLPWVFFFISSVYCSITTSKYRSSPFKKPRRNAMIAYFINTFIGAMFCTLLIISLAVLMTGILVGTQ